MKKKILVLLGTLLLFLGSVSAQRPNRVYNLYYIDTARLQGKVYPFPSGMAFRNDTLFISESAGITIVAVKHEADSGFSYIWLKSYKLEKLKVAKTDTTKKVQQKAVTKASPAKKPN